MDSNKSTQELHNEIDHLKKLIGTIERGKLMWEATFDVIADPVVVVNPDLTVQRANKAFAMACGVDVREVVAKKCHEIFAGHKQACPGCPLQTAGNGIARKQLETFPKNQRQYEAGAFKMSGRSEASVVLHYRDVTNQKQLQRQLVHNEKMAAIGRLAEGVAHEINNPLGAILAFTQIAEKALNQNHPCADDLREIEMATLRCQKIVCDLLNFARRSPEQQKEEINLNDLVHKALPVIRIQAKQVCADVQLHLVEDLPTCLGDVGRLEQVLLNLVANATHAMRDREGTLTLSTFTDETTKSVCLRIQDTGQGMSPEVLSRIFEPYFTTKQQGEGSGLGLSISHNIVQEHGGRIEAESQLGMGTTMTVVLPTLEENSKFKIQNSK
jgi:C4-dicarboxylate-specific signal transduction histidine kinase